MDCSHIGMWGSIQGSRGKDHVEIRREVSPLHLADAPDLSRHRDPLDIHLHRISDHETELCGGLFLD